MKKAVLGPWGWVPTVYIYEGLPNAIVNTVSLIVFKNMGMPNDKLTLYTSLLSFPWILKIVLSPFVDTIGTKRAWIFAMQALMAVSVGVLALTLPSCPLSLVLLMFLLTAFACSIHDIAADGFYMLGLSDRDQSLFVGIRNSFFRLALLCGQGLLAIIAGVLQNKGTDAVASWSYTLLGCSVIMALIALWDLFSMPKPENRLQEKSPRIATLFKSFVTKPGFLLALVFLLLYRLPEAFSMKILIPFLKDAREVGGLAIGDAQVGLISGTVGVIALLLGGILGGISGARVGLRKCMIPMALSLSLPCAVYLYLAISQPVSLWPVYLCIAIDQFGYGYGFTAYTLFMLQFSKGEFQTSHYAFCTVLMTFSMMLPGLVAGRIQMALGYTGFFVVVMLCCLVTLGVSLMILRFLKSEIL